MLDIFVSSIFTDEVVDVVLIKEQGQLGEDVFVIIHLPRLLAERKIKFVDSENLWILLILLLFLRTVSVFGG